RPRRRKGRRGSAPRPVPARSVRHYAPKENADGSRPTSFRGPVSSLPIRAVPGRSTPGPPLQIIRPRRTGGDEGAGRDGGRGGGGPGGRARGVGRARGGGGGGGVGAGEARGVGDRGGGAGGGVDPPGQPLGGGVRGRQLLVVEQRARRSRGREAAVEVSGGL